LIFAHSCDARPETFGSDFDLRYCVEQSGQILIGRDQFFRFLGHIILPHSHIRATAIPLCTHIHEVQQKCRHGQDRTASSVMTTRPGAIAHRRIVRVMRLIVHRP